MSHTLKRFLAHLVQTLTIAHSAPQHGGKASDIAHGIHKTGFRLANQIKVRSDPVAHDDRASAQHCFVDDKSKSVVRRRQH
jgi:hypothetical protein